MILIPHAACSMYVISRAESITPSFFLSVHVAIVLSSSVVGLRHITAINICTESDRHETSKKHQHSGLRYGLVAPLRARRPSESK